MKRSNFFVTSITFSVDGMSDSMILTLVQNGGTIRPRIVSSGDLYNIITFDGYEGVYPNDTHIGTHVHMDNRWECRQIFICGVYEAFACINSLNDKCILVRRLEELNDF